MTTGQRIKDRRLELGMTAEQLGEKVGVTKSTIGRYETGSIEKIPYLTFFKILLALDTTAREIIPEEEIKLIAGSDKLDLVFSMMDNMESEMRDRLKQLTPDQMAKVDAFAQGLLASDKE
ncbi:MAG: helix-turn-helix transcriptional regulator [Clostridia bacterium]|nr:helix-turn-helix transcriptional regulator [Clostridia bacterium]